MTEAKINLAIVIVNFNGVDDTLVCIDSILLSTCKFDYQIIVVDNGSKKNEAEMISEKYSKVVTIRSEENLGFSGGNNVAIRYAQNNEFSHVLLLNNDTVIDSEMLDILMTKSREDIVTIPRMMYYSCKENVWYGGGRINKFSGNVNVCKTISSTEEICTFATGCCMLIPIRVFEKVGLLKESYFMYCEDTEFSIRLVKAGVKMLYIPNAVLWHKVSASTGGEASYFSLYYTSRNRLNYIREHRDYFYVTAYMCAFFSRIIRAIQKAIMGDIRWKAYICAIRDHIKRIEGEVEISIGE